VRVFKAQEYSDHGNGSPLAIKGMAKIADSAANKSATNMEARTERKTVGEINENCSTQRENELESHVRNSTQFEHENDELMSAINQIDRVNRRKHSNFKLQNSPNYRMDRNRKVNKASCFIDQSHPSTYNPSREKLKNPRLQNRGSIKRPSLLTK